MEFDEIGQVKSIRLIKANSLLRDAVAALRKLSYADYLRSDHWLDFREAMLEEVTVCEHCDAVPSAQIHHLTYDYLGRERRGDVLVLCGPCHRKWHDQHQGERLSTPADDVTWAGRSRRFGQL
jgi:5-methylcytosine-specific restriction endonuclease McrA